MPIPSEPQAGLGAAVRQLREARGLSQQDFAHEAGLAISSVSLIERGRSNPTWATARRVAAALDVSLAELAKLAEKLER